MDTGIILDLETTGLDPRTDQIIEVGILEFTVSSDHPPVITEAYSGLEDPGRALSPEIEKITGLTQQVLSGKHVDWVRVRTMLERSAIIIAHHAEFDAGFLKRRPELNDLSCHWACSMRHLPWHSFGYRTTALNYLAADHGFINPFAHRALFDCATTFRLVAPRLEEIIKRSYEREFVIVATNSPFESKDRLKNKGYRWDNQQRLWKKTVLECDLSEERAFLEKEVYAGPPQHHEHPHTQGLWT